MIDSAFPTRPVMPLSDHEIDRAGHLRGDEDELARLRTRPGTRVLLLQDGSPLSEPSASGRAQRPGARPMGQAADGLIWLGAAAFGLGHAREIFLGLDREGDAVFALDMPQAFSLETSPIAGLGLFMEFRGAASGMSPFDAGLAATARSLFLWHARNRFCANCGAETTLSEAGWKRHCESCGAEHFPRTDPVAIMLAVKGDRCLLGRQASWPQGFWSCLAGYIEPGESVEQGAAREMLEEAGIRTDASRAHFLFSQPWPFPSSLMIGIVMPAENEDVTVDPKELDDARWFTRDEVGQMLDGSHPSAICPPPMAIAHHIMSAWART